MAQPTHNTEVDIVPTWLIVLLGLAWLLVTLATISYVSAVGPLA